jgi:large subunit ribosomal protein L22
MVTDKEEKIITEIKASARGVHVSPRKARLVAGVLKGLTVAEALEQLSFLNKKAALPMKKLVNSAVANASHNYEVESDRLYVKSLTVDQGRMFKRHAPRAHGQAFPVRKRTSHFNLILGVTSKVAPKKRLKTLPPKPELAPKAFAKPGKAETTETPKKGKLFSFWRKKPRPQETPKTKPRGEVYGKPYTSFDRRGNM